VGPTIPENHPADFNSIVVGDQAHLSKKVLFEDVQAFAALSGDYNPLHIDPNFSQRTRFHRRVAHGMLVASYVSRLIGMHLPGPGALWGQQNFRWRAPVFIDDELEISLMVTHKSEGTRTLALKVKAVNQDGAIVMEGDGLVMVLEMNSPDD
jgi:acyl dehydratase